MIAVILTSFTAIAFYSKAKAIGASKAKWTIVGILISLIPINIIPKFIIHLTGREDLDGPALMAAVVFVIIFSALAQRLIKK